MKEKIEPIAKGTVTSPQGFTAGAVEAAVKYKGRLDLGILYSEQPAVSAAVFTGNKVKAAPILISMKHQELGKARAVVVNSGCANACTGDKGLKDAEEMAGAAAFKLGIERTQMLVASTGVIGIELPLDRIKAAVDKIKLSKDGGHNLARAIMTTDTRPKEIALWVSDGTGHYIISGIAKGAGMIHPNMATLLSFLATDAKVSPAFLKKALKTAVDLTFNMITIDGDTSTNDMVSIIANGAAGNIMVQEKNGKVFQAALNEVCKYLACSIAGDGEGATKLIEITVTSAKNIADARKAVRTIGGSSLVKSAIHGNDPNWGRIVAALGRSGAYFEEPLLDVFLQGEQVLRQGRPLPFLKDKLSKQLKTDKVDIKVCLNIANGNATGWGCDLSQEYVTINSDYTT
jgi:glutamate N-acetyltransferase/amino-acid N-acetyltransferase